MGVLHRARAVIFDFDGTIIDSNAVKVGSFYALLGRFGIEDEKIKELLKSNSGKDRYGILKACSIDFKEYFSTATSAQDLVRQYSDICHSKLLLCPKLHAVDTFLERLQREGKLLYIASATPQRFLRQIVKDLKLKHFFCEVYGGPPTKEHHVRSIIERHQLLPSEVIFIGDSDDDRVAAELTGCHFFGVAHEPGRFTIKPHFTFKSYADKRLAFI